MHQTVLIAGGGHAAGQTAISLRQQGFEGRVTIVGEEPHLPYQRPPLSKKYLSGELGIERVYLRPEKFFTDNDIELVSGVRCEAIDRAQRQVSLSSGEPRGYDHLVMALGSRPRPLPVTGADLGNVFYLRTIGDVDAIRGALDKAQSLVVVGGGYIGLEVASVGTALGKRVTVVETADRILGRVTSPEMSDFFTRAHRSRGVDVRLGVGVSGFEGTDSVAAVLAAGERIPADLVIVGIGVIPNTELAAAAGLDCADGVRVDTRCRTTDPNIYAVGDCTRHPNPIVGAELRLESVQNALEQAKVAAANICGKDAEYAEVPWFWSDQFDLKLQMAGISTGYDQTVLRGSMESENFAVFYLKEGALVAVDAVNRPREFMACRQMLASRPTIAPERLADESIDMKEMA